MSLDDRTNRTLSPHNSRLLNFNVRRSMFNVRRSMFNVRRSTFGVRRSVLIVALLALAPLPSPADSSDVHLSYHWHLHQPIYWPEKAGSDNRYQNAKDSIDLKISNTGNFYPGSDHKHPRNNLVNGDGGEYDSVFDKDDRKIAYQHGGRDSIATLSGHADAGASVSYSGALQENIRALGRAGAYGYHGGWNGGYTEARGWTTSDGHPKADMIGITYHHSFSPLLPKSVLRKEVQIFKEIWWKSWGGNPDKSDHSKGFWPVECAFSRHMIPVLVEEGYQWVIVANSHLARTCANYMDVAQRGTSGWNIDPPNRADQLGPSVPANEWWNGQIDGRGGAFPAPYAYQAHKIKYVNPETGAETKMTAVPMCDLLSYQNGYSTMGTGDLDTHIAPYAGGSHPCIVLMAHDGDNAWGGGSSYYQESVPGLMNEAAGKGYQPTTIQQFLHDHPVPDSDVVHVEDGAWVNAANDWGHPQYINWLWPPARDKEDPGYDYDDPRTWIDIENGWAEDFRNWAVIVAAANYCEYAEQIRTGNGDAVNAWKIQAPHEPDGTYNNPNKAELAWHFMLGGLDSGFMYYGISLDDEVKQALACNRAVGLAQEAIADNNGSVGDSTPPTVFKPQRYPWNPGGMGWGPTTGYRPIGFDGAPPHYSDFHVWTLVHDVAGVTNVTLHVRRDRDGHNPLASNQNETYLGGGEVEGWADIAMTRRVLSPTRGHNGNTIDFFITPDHMADHYWAKVRGYNDTLLDYYVSAVDAHGNVHRSDIQHVYVGEGGSSRSSVTFSDDPNDCDPLVVTYDASGGPLDGIGTVLQRISFDGGSIWSNRTMANAGANAWVYTNTVPDDAPSATVNFHDGAGTEDDNSGANWSTSIRDCDEPVGPAVVTFSPAAPTGCVPVTITYEPNNGPLRYASQVYIHVGHDNWRDVITPDPAMTADNGTSTYVYVPRPGTEEINCCFNDGSVWDNNGDANWNVAVTGCGPTPFILVGGSPSVSDDPAGQNHATDAFDLNPYGNSARIRDQGGFGNFGRTHVNHDATNFYIGGEACDLAGSNNAMIVFLSFNTLGDDAVNLWGLSGLPNGLDHLHNVLFDAPMDMAVVIGDEWGDGTYTNFNIGNGYNFGQGAYYLSTGSGRFVPVAGARLSQFDGNGTNVTGATDYDGDRLMNRWEAAIPWTSLGASNIGAVTDCRICGVIASSSVSGNNRYVSGNYLGTGVDAPPSGDNYGFDLVTLTPQVVSLPGTDSDGDGIPDEWENEHFGGIGVADATTDWDSDGSSDRDEYRAGTDPRDAGSTLVFMGVAKPDGNQVVVRWQSVAGKLYNLYRTADLALPFTPVRSAIPATPPMNVYTDMVGAARARFYRVETGRD